MPIAVIIRTRNDGALLRCTLRAVRQQSVSCRVVLMNNNSEGNELPPETEELADLVVRVPDGEYRPGAVINQAVAACPESILVLLNADCPPLHPEWLEELIEPLNTPEVGATFGCQVPRLNCYPPLARDTKDTFGRGRHQRRWRHCFSMASSAFTREVWKSHPFHPLLRYSEDIEWSLRVRESGFEVRYVSASVVEHSHNYSLKQFYERQFGEGKAEARIFSWSRWRGSFLRYSLLPLLASVWRDTSYCIKQGNLKWVFLSPFYRVAAALGRRRGFQTGRRPI